MTQEKQNLPNIKNIENQLAKIQDLLDKGKNLTKKQKEFWGKYNENFEPESNTEEESNDPEVIKEEITQTTENIKNGQEKGIGIVNAIEDKAIATEGANELAGINTDVNTVINNGQKKIAQEENSLMVEFKDGKVKARELLQKEIVALETDIQKIDGKVSTINQTLDNLKQKKINKTIKEAQDKVNKHIDKRVEEENQKLDIKIEARELNFLANQEIEIKAKYFSTKEKIEELQNNNGSQEEIDLLNKELEIYSTQREEISKKIGEQTDKLNNLAEIKKEVLTEKEKDEGKIEENNPDLPEKSKRDRLSDLLDEEHQIKQNYFDLQNKVENGTASEEEKELFQQQKNRRSEIEQEKDELNKFFLGEEYFTKQNTNNTETIQEANPEIRNFLQKLSLENKDLLEFHNLNEAQKLKVVEDLKQRIVDLTKADANTQYAESIQSKMEQPTGGFFNKAKIGLLNFKNTIWSKVTKEATIKDGEVEAFNKLRNSQEGKNLITKEIKNLVKINKDRNIYLNENNKPQINFINKDEIANLTTEEEQEINHFNQIANIFRQMPYEWGQEGNKNKSKYDKTNKEYEFAREKILKIKSLREEIKGQAIVDTIQSDNAIRLDQLLNTHPEFEKEFNNLGEQKGVKEVAKTVGNFLETVTGGKNLTNKLLVGMGFGLRTLAKGAAVMTSITGITLVAAPIIGGTIGALRGKVHAKDTLKERKIQARHGVKDQSNEATNTNDAENLSKRIELLITSYNNAKTDTEKNEKLDQLKRRIEFTQDKIEQGLVNFGDAKNSLNNQFNLINALNNATVLSASTEEYTKKAIDERLEEFLAYQKNKISEKQKEFIKAQMKQSAMLGAGFATAGYLARWIGEQYGLFGNIQETQAKNINITPGASNELKIEDNTFPQDNVRVVKNLDIKKPDFSETINTEEIKEVIEDNKPQNEIIIEDNTVPQDNTRVAQYLEKPKDFTNAKLDTEEVKIIERNDEIKIEDNTVPQDNTRVENHVEKPNEFIKPKTIETNPDETNPEINEVFKANPDAIVRKGEGVTHVFVRQMENNHELAKELGFKGDFENSKDLIKFSKELAIKTGYIDQEGHEIRVLEANKIAYEIKVVDHKIIVNEIDAETGKIIEIHHEGDTLEKDIDKHEYTENKKYSYKERSTGVNDLQKEDDPSPIKIGTQENSTDSSLTTESNPTQAEPDSLTKEETASPVKTNDIEKSTEWEKNKDKNFYKFLSNKNVTYTAEEIKIFDYLQKDYAEALKKDSKLLDYLMARKDGIEIEEASKLFHKINHEGFKTEPDGPNLPDNKGDILIPENLKNNPEFKALSIIAEKNKYNLTEDMFKNIEKTKTGSLKAVFGEKNTGIFEKYKDVPVGIYKEKYDDDLERYLEMLEEKTGLTPKVVGIKELGEKVEDFINRALLHAENKGISNQVMFIKEKFLDENNQYYDYKNNQ